jgi:hypothetical protein
MMEVSDYFLNVIGLFEILGVLKLSYSEFGA